MTDDVDRRDVLRAGAGLGAVALLPGLAAADDGPIPAPFDELPTLDEPTESDRLVAGVTLPPRAVPDEGAIPDPFHNAVVEKDLVVPEWGLEAARWRLEQADDPGRGKAERILTEYAYIRERFVTTDGRDAVDAVLEDHD